VVLPIAKDVLALRRNFALAHLPEDNYDACRNMSIRFSGDMSFSVNLLSLRKAC